MKRRGCSVRGRKRRRGESVRARLRQLPRQRGGKKRKRRSLKDKKNNS
jgi:hypothetical protein